MPVQEQVIPYLLNSDKDVISLAQTGTGKTAAYGIPVLQQIDGTKRQPQALVLSPTRELCLQIADDLNSFAKYLKDIRVLPVYGGASIQTQIHSLKHGVQIIVATPGRLIDLINRGVVKLDAVKYVVLDEADEMLNMGFSDSINEIFEHVPEERHTLLFSATMSKEIEKIAKNYLHEYEEIVVGSRNEGAEHVNHIYYLVNAKDKYLALKRVVDFYPRIYAIIFCRTKLETQEIADKLIKDGYNAESLHGDLSQAQRDLTMQKFRQHHVQLLVATDVAARGLDVDDLTHVINYGLPDDIEVYTHRSGRTGRAGKKGTSISIIHTRERYKVRQIEKEIGKAFVDGTLPTAEEICKKQLYKAMDDIMKTDVDEEMIKPYMVDVKRWFEYIDKEDILKKVVTLTFGRFLNYYKNAPEIIKPDPSRAKGEKKVKDHKPAGNHKQAEAGYRRLFINLGKKDGFYPGEVMQLLNKYVKGHQQVGHIDLLERFSYIEVPEHDAQKVMAALSGVRYKGREVRCNDADEPRGTNGRHSEGRRSERKPAAKKPVPRKFRSEKGNAESGDWRELMRNASVQLRGEEPDFSEEGWARRRPKKK